MCGHCVGSRETGTDPEILRDPGDWRALRSGQGRDLSSDLIYAERGVESERSLLVLTCLAVVTDRLVSAVETAVSARLPIFAPGPTRKVKRGSVLIEGPCG